jgi:hypothetical protein
MKRVTLVFVLFCTVSVMWGQEPSPRLLEPDITVRSSDGVTVAGKTQLISALDFRNKCVSSGTKAFGGTHPLNTVRLWKDLAIVIEGREIKVPKEYLSRFAEPLSDSIKIKAISGFKTVSFRGSDGEKAYTATFFLNEKSMQWEKLEVRRVNCVDSVIDIKWETRVR